MSDFCPRGNRAMLSVMLLAVLAVGACDKIDQFRTSHPVAKIASAAPVDTFSVHAMTDSNIVTVIARDYSFESGSAACRVHHVPIGESWHARAQRAAAEVQGREERERPDHVGARRVPATVVGGVRGRAESRGSGEA